MEYTDEQLHELWRHEMLIMHKLEDFFNEHGLSYSIAYGTMLGAVRHRGFIPWDDDFDIWMMRADYDKFLALAQENPIPELVLQTNDINPSYPNNFAKVHLRNTQFVEEGSQQEPVHHGIKIDIFPLDAVAPTAPGRLWQKLNALFHMLYCRNYVSKKDGLVPYYAGKAFLWLTPRSLRPGLKKYTLRQMTRHNAAPCPGSHYFCPVTFAYLDMKFEHDWVSDIKKVPYEDTQFSCFAGSEGMLHAIYGDFMTLPPVEKRKLSHQPQCIDFSNPYPGDERWDNQRPPAIRTTV